MSQDFNLKQMTTSQSTTYTKPCESKNRGAMCTLSLVFIAVGVMTIAVGVFFGIKAMSSVLMEDMAPVYFVGGILSGLFYFALAVIVEACTKYVELHK